MKKGYKKVQIMILIMVLLLIIAGCRRTIGPEEVEDNQPPTEQEMTEEETQDIEEAPIEEGPLQFTLENQRQEEVTLSELKGKPIFLTFWVSWDEDSKEQLEVLHNLQRLLEEDVSFVGVNATTFETAEHKDILAYLEEQEYEFHIVFDDEGEVQDAYYVGSFPTTFLLDESGEVVQLFTTLMKEDKMIEALEPVLEKLLP
ncbi:TlpA disulfide reductase family protein [Alkaliphilus metalliredigens]|nr:TlpA disulfide reductase family protein [Alkaliphilus metalliredigens]